MASSVNIMLGFPKCMVGEVDAGDLRTLPSDMKGIYTYNIYMVQNIIFYVI